MSELRNPHDAFFKQVLARPEIAADLLRNHLPPALVEQIDWSQLALQKDTFIDPDLQAQFSDLLYRVPLRMGTDIFLYLLFEHKSQPERYTRLQLLGYMVRIWEKERRESGKLSPIVPLVVYHGRRKWRHARRFEALFQAPQQVRKYLPRFEHELLDLSALPDEAIRGEVMVRVVQLVLKHIFDDNLGARLPDILALAAQVLQQESGLEMLVTILRYVSQAGRNVTGEELRMALASALPAEGGILMQTLAEQWLAQGREQGLVAQRETLLLILRHRFPISDPTLAWLIDRIGKVDDLPRLMQWINAALSADSLDAFITQMNDSLAVEQPKS
jgi:predicted transposase/invertase (TIGR01784 family)